MKTVEEFRAALHTRMVEKATAERAAANGMHHDNPYKALRLREARTWEAAIEMLKEETA